MSGIGGGCVESECVEGGVGGGFVVSGLFLSARAVRGLPIPLSKAVGWFVINSGTVSGSVRFGTRTKDPKMVAVDGKPMDSQRDRGVVS